MDIDGAGDTVSIESLRLPTRRAFLPCVEDPTTHLIYCFGGQARPGSWVKYDEITVFTPFGVVPPNSRPVANDSDADGDSLTATLEQDAQQGSVNLVPDGSFVYTPTSGFSGTDTFTYRAEDASSQSAETTVSVRVGILVFEDGFESGDTRQWSASVP